MWSPKLITTVDEAHTNPWTIQSFGYDTALDAKMAAAKVFVAKKGALVKPHAGKWAVFFHQAPVLRHEG